MYNGKSNIANKNRVANVNKSLSHHDNRLRRCPKYAIVRLAEGTNVLQFYKLLLDNGHEEVSFVNEVCENGFQLLKGQCSSIDGDNEKTLASKGHGTAEEGKKATADSVDVQSRQQLNPQKEDKAVQVAIAERTLFASPSFSSSSLRTQMPASPILRTAKKEPKPPNDSLIPLRDATNQTKLCFD